MTPSDAEYAAALVARRLSLPVKARLLAADRLTLIPSDLHESDGFSVELHTGWRTAEAHFVPGRSARPLIAKMGEAEVKPGHPCPRFQSQQRSKVR